MAEYVKRNWKDAPSTETPINAENLNAMDEGISEAHEKIKEITDGNIPIGNAKKLGGYEAEYFAQATQLEIYRPTLYVGNTIDELTSIYDDLHITANNAWYCARVQHGVNNYYSMPAYRYYVEGFASEDYGYQIATTYNSANKMLRYFRSISAGTWTDWARITTEVDLADYFLKSGGSVTGHVGVNNGTGIVMGSSTEVNVINRNGKNSAANQRALVVFNSSGKSDVKEALGLRDRVNGVDTLYNVFHTGNSKAVVMSTADSPPSDTSALWVVTE